MRHCPREGLFAPGRYVRSYRLEYVRTVFSALTAVKNKVKMKLAKSDSSPAEPRTKWEVGPWKR